MVTDDRKVKGMTSMSKMRRRGPNRMKRNEPPRGSWWRLPGLGTMISPAQRHDENMRCNPSPNACAITLADRMLAAENL